VPTHVKRLPKQDIVGWVDQMTLGFHHNLPETFPEHLLTTIDLERTWAAYDGAKVVGTLRSFATELTVPGPAEISAAALTNVTVAPTHRRRGLLTGMITSDLKASKELGEPAGILIASEWPIYGHFGYGPAVQGAQYHVDTAALQWRRPSEGTVEIVDRTTMRTAARAVYETWRVTQPGAIGRDDHWWDRALHQIEVPGDDPPKERNGLYRSPAGEIEGYVRYHTKADWEGMRPKGRLELDELVAVTPAAYQALWDYCASVDLLVEIQAGDRPIDDHLQLLLVNGRHVKQTMRFDFIWVRVLDTVAALEGRRYQGEGRVVIEVVDDLGLTGGRFALEGGADGASCKATGETADLTMPVGTLGAAYLGGESFKRLQAAGWLDENTAGSVRRADQMFLTPGAPWCNTWF
jgi:predicted acetyltransferase